MFALKPPLGRENKSSKKVTFYATKSTILVIPELVCLNSGVNALLGLVLPSGLHLALQFLQHEIFHCIDFPGLTRATSGLQQCLPAAMGYCSPKKLSQSKKIQLTLSSPIFQAWGLWPPQCPQNWSTGPLVQHTKWADAFLAQRKTHIIISRHWLPQQVASADYFTCVQYCWIFHSVQYFTSGGFFLLRHKYLMGFLSLFHPSWSIYPSLYCEFTKWFWEDSVFILSSMCHLRENCKKLESCSSTAIRCLIAKARFLPPCVQQPYWQTYVHM